MKGLRKVGSVNSYKNFFPNPDQKVNFLVPYTPWKIFTYALSLIHTSY